MRDLFGEEIVMKFEYPREVLDLLHEMKQTHPGASISDMCGLEAMQNDEFTSLPFSTEIDGNYWGGVKSPTGVVYLCCFN
jgi:hypothetical protein